MCRNFLLILLPLLMASCSSSDPCELLLKRACAAGGEELCATLREQHRDRAGEPEAERACQDIVDSPQRFAEVLDGLRAAAALKVSLKAAPAEPEAGESDEAPGGSAVKKPTPTERDGGSSAAPLQPSSPVPTPPSTRPAAPGAATPGEGSGAPKKPSGAGGS